MRFSRVLALLLIAACVTSAAGQTVSLRPGRYETVAEIDMAGTKMPSQKGIQCITDDDLTTLSKKLIEQQFGEDCKVSDYKASGNKITFNTECKDEDAKTMNVEMVFAAESFTLLIKSKDSSGQVMNIRSTAKRTGECAK
jgi:hypothetical protein